jgi:outer membrane protein assembly factor BamB
LPIDVAKRADLLWSRPVGGVVDTPVLEGNLLLMATDGAQPQLQVLDLTTGIEIWRRALEAG